MGFMQPPGQQGAQGQPGLTQQPPSQLQFGPESLMALLMSMMSGGPQAMGQQAGNGMAVGANSMQGMLPQLLAALQPVAGGASTQTPGQPPGKPGGQPGSTAAPGQSPGGQQPPQQQQGPMQGLMQILQMLGMGGGLGKQMGAPMQ